MSKRSSTALLYGVLALSSCAYSTHAADDAASSAHTATEYVEMAFERACDVNNKLLVLENRHDYKTIIVTIRWSAWQGETLTQDVFAPPKTATDLGCAVTGEILHASFTDF